MVILLQYKISFAASSNEVDTENAPIDTSLLKATQITPVLDAKINTDENLIYCSTFQIAWNRLIKNVLKNETIEIENAPEYMKSLNSQINDFLDIPIEPYTELIGNEKNGTAEKISSTDQNLKININIEDNDIVILASLKKTIMFEYEFDKLPVPLYFQKGPDYLMNKNNGIPVEWFGIDAYNPDNLRHKNLSEIIEIPYYCHRGEAKFIPEGFIVKLITLSNDDELYFSTVKAENTLEKTYKKINDLANGNYLPYLDSREVEIIYNQHKEVIKSFPEKLVKYLVQECNIQNIKWGSSIRIPEIKINLKKIFLIGNHINNSNNTISKASQNIYFNLFVNNLPLKEAPIMGGGNGCFSIDIPYVIFLRKKSSKYPYFMAYICNSELMIPKNRIMVRIQQFENDGIPSPYYEFTDEVNIPKINRKIYNVYEWFK